MTFCFFVSDLHGSIGRFESLFNQIEHDKPLAVFIGGDITPHYRRPYKDYPNFIEDYIGLRLKSLKDNMGDEYPNIFIIPGNDDPASDIPSFKKLDSMALWNYSHFMKYSIANFCITGYSFVPPTPFLLKDWERFDIAEQYEPGCIPPCKGMRTTSFNSESINGVTIKDDLSKLAEDGDMSHSIFLFHTPPYNTNLDRAALDGKKIDQKQVKVNVGSVAVRNFIESYQPKITLHGHIHESARLTGNWMQTLGKTVMMTAAHDGRELALIKFDAEKPQEAERFLI